ncbi:MAG: 3-hydroxyacyl-CoA dehydrogenase NAD-binding domain-containing protein, partial [Chloroflexi bacterium]|nr:3-hydroxyacyl-CoA dehydrogenase NAD-binding domain-containing protein [Chloroflexota bacterium]
LCEPDLARAVAGRDRIAANLAKLAAKGRLEPGERDAALARIVATDDLGSAAAADLAVEAVPEEFAVKRAVLGSIDAAIHPGALLATNTSSISIDRLAEALSPGRRSRFLGLHFFSPVPVMPLVELVRGSATEAAALDAARAFAESLGKRTVLSADRPGFIVNRMLMPLLAEAMRVLEEGTATAADIDAGAKLGLNHPMGPLELADFIGLDVCLGIMRVLEAELGPAYAPPASLIALVEAGHLGRKSGRGFHAYG